MMLFFIAAADSSFPQKDDIPEFREFVKSRMTPFPVTLGARLAKFYLSIGR